MLHCKLGLGAKKPIPLRGAILALIFKTANDAAMVVAENIKDSEEKFLQLMIIRAH